MSLRAALERIADGTRQEREAAVGVLRNSLMGMARSVASRHSDIEDVVQDLTLYVTQQCLGGVPSTWPRADATLGSYLHTSVQRRLAGKSVRSARQVSLELPVDGELRTGGERPQLAQEAALKVDEYQRKAEGASYLEQALSFISSLVHAVIAARAPRFRQEAVGTWNAMVEVYAGTELDELISRGGRTPDKGQRERWYTRFKNFRHALLEQLGQSPLSADERELVGQFIQVCLTQRGQLSDLRALRISFGMEDHS